MFHKRVRCSQQKTNVKEEVTMLKEGDKLICKTKGLPETEFCIRGVVKSVVGDKVTISRALKFGQLPM